MDSFSTIHHESKIKKYDRISFILVWLARKIGETFTKAYENIYGISPTCIISRCNWQTDGKAFKKRRKNI